MGIIEDFAEREDARWEAFLADQHRRGLHDYDEHDECSLCEDQAAE